VKRTNARGGDGWGKMLGKRKGGDDTGTRFVSKKRTIKKTEKVNNPPQPEKKKKNKWIKIQH